MKLILPEISLFPAFQAMLKEFEAHQEAQFQKERNWSQTDFKQYLKLLNDHREGINLPNGRMPQAVYWLINHEQDIVATGAVRIRLNPHLLKEGGHIGYTVVPRFRRQGIGTFLLTELLKKAWEYDIDRVLVTCNEDNIGSRKIIKKNGGIYENKVFSEEKNAVVLRYWIENKPEIK